MAIILKKANLEDIRFFLNVRNDKDVRRFSFSSDIIRFNNHKKWFLDKFKNSKCLLFVIKYGKTKVGTLRVDLDNKSGTVNIAILPKFRGIGLGSKSFDTLVFALKKSKSNRRIKLLKAYIKSINVGSIKAFQKSGFKFKSKLIVKSVPTRLMIRKLS